MSKPIIKILQYMYGSFAHFAWSERINRRYCEQHGYTYVLRRDTPRKERHVCWHKVPLFLEELRDCDYLLFLDADAVFYSHTLTIEDELIPELRGSPILMTQDCAGESLRWNPGQPSSGVMLAKNTERVKEFFTQWNLVSDMDKGTRWRWPPEQLALWRHIVPKFKGDLRVILDYYLVQGRYGQFIRHFSPCSAEECVRAMETIDNRLSTPNP